MIKTYLQELQECLEKAETEQEKNHYRELVKKEDDYRKMLREKWAKQWKKEGLDDETIKIKTQKKEADAQKAREKRILKDEKMRKEWDNLPQKEKIMRNMCSMVSLGWSLTKDDKEIMIGAGLSSDEIASVLATPVQEGYKDGVYTGKTGYAVAKRENILGYLGGDRFLKKTKSIVIKQEEKHLLLELQTSKKQIYDRLSIELSSDDPMFGEQFDMKFESTISMNSKTLISIHSDQLKTMFENIIGLDL